MNKILIGLDNTSPIYAFTDADVKTVSCVLSSALVGDELAIDQLLPQVVTTASIRVVFAPSGASSLLTADGKTFMVFPRSQLKDVPYGTPVRYYRDGALVGKFYLKSVDRIGKEHFDITAVSAIGLLDGIPHYGGIYTGQPLSEVLEDVIGGVVPYTVSDAVAGLKLYGWLPVGTRRSNLHQVTFALGIAIGKDANGNMTFDYPDTETVKSVPDSRIFYGGSVDYTTPATQVEITEHAFYKRTADETVTLFDNTDGSGVAEHTLVTFRDAPCYDLKVSGTLRILESGVNYAILDGTGVLSGKKYTHTTKIVKMTADANGEQRSVSVTDATLVSVSNSRNVARRILQYYSSSRTVSADIVLDGEKPGDQIAFNDPFGDQATAFLASAEVRASSFLRASCDLVTGYKPTALGNNYSSFELLTGSGVWQRQAGVKEILAVLIGGGDGGQSGTDGEDSTQHTANDYAKAGKGGRPGKAGLGGKILSITMDVSNVSSISYRCGIGGLGGVRTDGTEPVDGQPGGVTTFGEYSTANGVESTVGTVNLLSGDTYGNPGVDGVAGGDGCDYGDITTGAWGKEQVDTDPVSFNGQTWVCGRPGDDTSGSGAQSKGGFGGGAAVGNNGGAGTTGIISSGSDVDGGNGGNGADAIPGENGVSYGSGGSGGHGGGGGGIPGFGVSKDDTPVFDGSIGTGGLGSKGGDGIDGCILIYMRGDF